MTYQPPKGPPPGAALSSNNPYKNVRNSTSQDYDKQAEKMSEKTTSDYQYAPPPGPPPSAKGKEAAPPAYDPWMAVPDNAMLPPPPAMYNQFSPANNASWDEAKAARHWCSQNALWGPRTWPSTANQQIQAHHLSLTPPPGVKGMDVKALSPSRTYLQSSKQQGDVTVLSSLPLFTPLHLPLQPGQDQTIYFEVQIKWMSGSDASVALGFVAPPYPPGRLPGWHRGSLAVHNDDGRRFVNDDEGGTDFVAPFGAGDRVGLGMTFTGSQYQGQSAKVRIFFTRNGREEGSWDLHESRDVEAQGGGVEGLDGTTDLYAAIGVCAGVELEVIWNE